MLMDVSQNSFCIQNYCKSVGCLYYYWYCYWAHWTWWMINGWYFDEIVITKRVNLIIKNKAEYIRVGDDQ